MRATSTIRQLRTWVGVAAAAVGLGGALSAQMPRNVSMFSPDEQQVMTRGQTIYTALCFSCHGADGQGAPKPGGPPGDTLGPSLAGSTHVRGHRDFVIKVLLHGLTGSPNGKTYPEVMIPMGSQDDAWVAAIGSFVRNSFGNSASFIAPADVARVRALNKARKTSWTIAELEASLPTPLQTTGAWRVSASEDSENAPRGLTPAGWHTAGPAKAGMWYQVELPQLTSIGEVQYAAPTPMAGSGSTTALPGARGSQRVAPPPELQVQVSTDGRTWSAPLVGAASGMLTTFAFQPTRTRFVRIIRNAPAPHDAPWTIQNLQIFRVPALPGPRGR